MNQTLEEEIKNSRIIDHEFLFRVRVLPDNRIQFSFDEETVEISFDSEALKDNSEGYIKNLLTEQRKYWLALEPQPPHAKSDLHRIELGIKSARVELQLFHPCLLKPFYFFSYLVTRKPFEEWMYEHHVQHYVQKIENYDLLSKIFCNGAEMLREYSTLQQGSSEHQEETSKCFIAAQKMVNTYDSLRELSKQRKTKKELWYYTYFPEERKKRFK